MSAAPVDGGTPPVPLRKWLWRSYLRSALIPLLVIELTFLAIYWASTAVVYRENVAAVGQISHDYLDDVARREATSISNSLAGVGTVTTLFARQAGLALQGNYQPPASEKARYARTDYGAFYTVRDNGGTASFHSGHVPAGPEQIDKVWRLAAIDPLMIDIKNTNPQVASLYVNTRESYNRIYPYFDVLTQYPKKMNIPEYNFYYEADARHNPGRRQVWTDAYVDPAGHGWMVSSIAPVWMNERLEAVVGIDVTLNTIIDRLLRLKLPWNAYAVLVGRDGRIIALSPQGEEDFKLSELTAHSYDQAVMGDTFKPEQFDLDLRPDTRALAQVMAKAPDGSAELDFGGVHLASFATVPGPGWRLVVIAPAKEIYRKAETLRERTERVGYVMLVGLLLFYVVFLVLLYRRAQDMSVRVAAPLGTISALLGRIGAGDYRQQFAGSRVEELDDLGRELVQAGHQLGDAHDRIVEQDRLVSRALARQWQLHEEQVRFIRTMSHELRTPLAVIDSGAQIIDRKAESLAPADLHTRAGKLRGAVRQISDLLHRLVATTQMERDFATAETPPVPVAPLIEEIAREIVPAENLHLDLGYQDDAIADAMIPEGMPLALSLRAVLDNAVRYAPGPVAVGLVVDAGSAVVTIADNGSGIPAEQLADVGKRFFRGSDAIGIAGAGLGVHLARTVVEHAGGVLTLVSDSGGTVVRITLPLARGADEGPLA